jgi:S1-C subfamily serine protease
MSDRFDDFGVERASEPTPAAPQGAGSDQPSADDLPGQSASEAPMRWAVPLGGQPEPVVSHEAVAPEPPTLPGMEAPGATIWAPPPIYASGAARPDSDTGRSKAGSRVRSGGQRGSRWLLVAVVAALIGAGVGAGVTALANSRSSTVTIKENTASPGAAIDNGANIPDLVDKLLPAVVAIEVTTPEEEDEGSGMIISANGMVVTNYHVIALAAEGGGALTVTEAGSTTAQKATLVGTDQSDDVALLRITGASKLSTVTFGDSDKAVIGDAVVAIGNALGLSQGSPTVTQGIVSALGRTVTAGDTASDSETLSDLIQTDAAINPGNSGGPLVDTEGDVIGMDTAVAGTTSDGTDAQNIGFAIPSAQIESLLPNLEKGGTPATTPGYIGVAVETLSPQLRSEYGLTPSSGAVIEATVPGGPANLAGLGQEDVIVGFGSEKITSAADLETAAQSDKAGQSVKITYYRGDREHTVSLTLVSGAAIQSLEEQSEQGSDGGLGGGSGGSTVAP